MRVVESASGVFITHKTLGAIHVDLFHSASFHLGRGIAFAASQYFLPLMDPLIDEVEILATVGNS